MPKVHFEQAHAKLTRSLRVVGQRSDGFHLIRAEMVTLDLCDELEIGDGDGLEIVDQISWVNEDSGNEMSAIPRDRENLVIRALEFADRKAHVRLTKRIPHGAGLGGGSADAAAILRWAGVEIANRVSVLGADVPFCLRGGHAMVQGIGEFVEPMEDLSTTLVLVSPAIEISTLKVYSVFDDLGAGDRSKSSNDLEKAAVTVEPRLTFFRDLVEQVSARRPNLAGSGATWFVECSEDESIDLHAALRKAIEASGERALVTLAHTVGASMA